jgi:hypothetical protein
MDLIVVVHPAGHCGERCGGVRDRVHADIVSLEGFDEGLGHAIAFGALHGREARLQVERDPVSIVLAAM